MEEFRIVLADACKIVKESSRKRVISGADEDGRVMVEFSEPVGGRRVKMLTPDEINGMLYKEETSESPANAEEAMAEETEPPTAGQEESGESAFERIPKDTQTGEPQYTQTDAPTAWDAIVEQTEGDEDMARSVVDSTVSDKEAALKKLESSNPKPGATVAEKIAAAKEHKAAIEAARQELEQWKAIAEVENSRKAEAEAEAKAKAEEEEAKARAKAEAEEETGVKLSDEIDENGRQFVLTSNGDLAFGEIGKNTGLTEAPILLSEGVITNTSTNDGYGLAHIEARHGEQIRKAGYKSVIDFIEKVAKNYDVIKKGSLRDGRQTYRLQLTDKHNNTLMVELSDDGTYWNINTAGIFKTSYGKKNEEVYNRHTTVKQSVETVETSQDTEQSDTQVSPSMNVPTTSTGKVSESPETKQEKAEKSISAKVKEASADVNTEPTEAQKEAGNYKKGHVQVGTFDITIEQPEGSIRRGTDADGKQWESKMHNTYGYFRGTEGVDGDHIDVFLSNDMDGWNGAQVFVVDQYNPDGTFDEHKVMLGFNDASDAKNNYLANYKKGWEKGRRIDVSAVSLADFEKWIASSHRKTKPFREYKSVKPADDSETFKGHKVENSGKDIEAQIKHLEEIKDYPGADKKIVQSEIDRLKAKEEATAKSKSEEVKSKSKEENGVDDAKIDAVLEALSKGDEKAEQLVQRLTSRELSKLRSKVKASPVLENEWLHRVRTRGDVSLHDWLLENQYVEPVKRVSGTFKMTDYITPKNSKLYGGRLSGVYHDDKGYAVASDGIILVADKGSYDPKLKGKVIGKDGAAMENKFPGWQRIILAAKETKSSNIDVEDLHRFVAGVLKADKHAYISLRFPDGTTAAFNADRLNLMLRAMKQLGTSELLYTKDGMKLVAKSEKGTALLMGLVSVEDELVEANGYAYPGNTVSYQRGEVVGETSQEERVLRDAVIDRLRESGMEVITDEEAGQRVLDEANGKVRQMSFGEPYDYAAYPYGRVEPNLAEKEVNVVAADANHGFNNYKEAKTWAKQNVSKSYNDKETGGKGNVRISNAAIDKFLSQSAVDKSDSKDVHMAVLKVLPGLLKTSIDVETHPDFIKGEDGKRNAENGINKDVLVHRCYGAVSLDGKLYRVKITLKEDPRDLSFPHVTHSYEATKIELLAGTWENRKSPSPNTSNSITAAKLLENVGMSYNPGEKVLAASEKRSANIREQRVYHGSGADFDRFDHSHMGEGEGSQAFGWGTYVTNSKDIGFYYATRIDNDPSKRSILFQHSNGTRFKKKYPTLESFLQDTKRMAINGKVTEQEKIDYYHKMMKLAEPYHNLYAVEIPEDNGKNYLDWDSRVGARVLSKVNRQLEKQGKRPINPELAKRYKFLDGNDLYRALSIRMPNDDATFNDDKAASEFLYSLGFVGIKYKAGRNFGAAKEGDTNYVIFNEKDAKITDHVRFFRTAKGEAYGFTVGGKIYIDPKIANTETPIHEYAHLWAAALRGQNPKEWRNIVELMKGTSVWDEVKKRYPELNTDDDIADEVLATYSGRRGAERLREEQRKIAGNKGGVFEKAEAISALERVKQALRKFWKSVADFLHIHYKSAEEVADRVMKDLLDGVDPGKHFNSRMDDPRFMFAGEKGAARADREEEALTRQNNLDVAQKMEAAKKEAKAIKLATGWERGADGKWRYEIPDGIYHPKGDAELKKALAKQPWREELIGLSDRILDGEGLSKEETERFNELAEKEAAFKADYLKKEKPHLADWLENDELFKAYPELKRVGVVFTDNMPKEQAGYYDSKSNTITVNTNSSEDTASIIAHEVQHAIQRYEGFATGGNLKAAMEYLSGNKRADVKIKQQLAYKLSQEKGLGLSEEEVNSLIGHLEYEDIPDDELQKQIDALCQKHNITEDQLEDIYPMDSVWHEAYNRISGEAEARNVQKRMGMTAEERGASLAADTEDVARDSQILLFDDTGKNMSLESPKEDDINAKFNIRLAELVKNPDQKDKVLHLGRSSKFLTDGGLADAEIILEFDKLAHKSKEGYKHEHPFDISDIKDLPKAISSPIAVFDNTNGKNDGRVILTELKKDGRNFIVAVKTSAQNRRGGIVLEVNQITTLFPKDAKGIVYWFNSGKATNIDKEKALRFIEALPNHPGTTIKEEELFSAAKVVENFENSKFESENDALFRGGKELRDGRKIEFVRKPTATYNALARHLQAEGIKPDMHEARTGSRYMSFEKDGVQWEVRSSDHTKPEYYGEAQKPVELTYYKDKQGEENLSVSVDLGTSGYNIEDMKALMAEIDRLKNDAGEVKESFDKGVVSDEAAKRYPLLSQALGVKSENEVRAEEEARKHAEEARKQEMRSAVEDMAGRLHLNNVDIVDKPAERGAGRRERAKGMFERSTGRITINIGNCADKRDAVVTLLHEAVAHHGLRKLFGENFETFLDNVYNSANAEIHRIIDKHSRRYGGDKRTATEEYMASLAERTDFENAKKSGWWQRIKDFFLKMLEKIGLKGFKGEDLSDNELRYVLWRSYENLKSGGKDTVFSAADDLAKQSELKVGEFAPDAKKTAPEENAEEVNERFNNELTRYQSGDMDKNEMLHLGKPQGVMRTFLPNLPIVMRQRVIKKGSEKKHEVDVSAIMNMPQHLSSPIFVFQRSEDTIGVLTDMRDRNGKNVCVAIELKRQIQQGAEYLEVNDVRSFHGREFKNIVEPIANNKALKWVDKEKGLAYLSSASQPVQQEIDKQVLDTATKVVKDFVNPKSESENDALFRDGAAKDYEKAQARETYERRVSTGMFQSREAIQDSMLSLKVAMDAIEEATAGKAKRIEDYDGFENAYLGENRLSSVNQAESAAFAHLLIRPMMEEVNRLAPTAKDRAELIDYMFAKHGLERNAYMRQQAAEKKLAEYKKQNPGTAKTAADFIDAERDYAGLTTLTGKADVSAAEAEAQRMAADYEKDYTFHGI